MADLNVERKKARDHLLDKCSPQLRREQIEIDGVKYEVRQMTGAQRDRIFTKACIVLDHPELAKNHQFCVECAMELLYWPETGERVFGVADRESLMELPSGTEWLEQVGVAASTLLGRARESGKESARNPAAGSSSASPANSG